MLPTTIAKNLSIPQRNCLIAHIDPQPFNITDRTASIMIERGLLCGSDTGVRRDRVKSLRLTELGKETVCHVLGEYADFLVACGCLGGLTKYQFLQNIRRASMRRPQCDITISPADATPTDTHAQNMLRDRAASLRLLHLLQGGSSPTRSP